MAYLKLNNIGVYKKAFSLSNYIWIVVRKWDMFAKNTIGSQFVRSADSISANIAEGFGKYYLKDMVRHYRISRGSTLETLDWNEKARKRELIDEKEYKYILNVLQDLPKEINQLVKFTKGSMKKAII
ncbi:MAG: hypothetical protein US75_C0007G0028 [Candidatus Woesebacteria bacterium GW2011_GWC1_38_13]|uniref:S23 ribosomal protein n=2 Tax=Candidatus Woeseibacteriota TaxID=1752722 RepID=A0A0G0NDU7_9BACT|nr:MAG: hypothetical protein US75_C0007G0028 [Candidatus Woesebacteria bacterium GW2011_GWC1_38_13]KKQ84074.1 MAG: hypothetical protein UT06_C0011G0063 [Candidatus Woesebacteria bacterium GW2011_GWA1_38_8]